MGIKRIMLLADGATKGLEDKTRVKSLQLNSSRRSPPALIGLWSGVNTDFGWPQDSMLLISKTFNRAQCYISASNLSQFFFSSHVRICANQRFQYYCSRCSRWAHSSAQRGQTICCVYRVEEDRRSKPQKT